MLANPITIFAVLIPNPISVFPTYATVALSAICIAAIAWAMFKEKKR